MGIINGFIWMRWVKIWMMIWVIVGFEFVYMNEGFEFFVVGVFVYFVGVVWINFIYIEGIFLWVG